jgi:Ca2+-binding RTX toxin-like protein
MGGNLAVPLPNGTISEMGDYLKQGFWDWFGGSFYRSFNMGSSGTGANSGIIYYDYDGYAGTIGGWSDADGLSAARRALVDDVLDYIGEITGINFVHSSSPPDGGGVDLYFRDSDTSGAYANSVLYGSGNGTANHRYIDYSYVNINNSWSGGTSDVNDYTYQTFIHEIFHALGLGHQGAYNGTVNFITDTTQASTNNNVFLNDSWQMSIMSYIDQVQNTTVDADFNYVITGMAADFETLRDYYGYHAFTGNTTYGFNTNIAIGTSETLHNLSTWADETAFSIVDDGGIDTVDFSGYAADQVINLQVATSGSTVGSVSNIGGQVGNMTLAVGTVIENAVGGSGSDDIYGNDANNDLTGNGGADLMKGLGGIDYLYGGTGGDTLYGGDATDYLYGSTGVTGDGDTSANTLEGDAGDDYLRGGDGNDSLYGDDGNDELRGNGGDDALYGGTGTDEADYYYATGAVTVSLATNTSSGADGNDTLDSIENIYGSVYGDTLTGNGSANVINGGDGADSITGGGGGDTLYGLSGDDTLYRSGGGSLQNAYYGGTGSDTINTDGSGFVDGVVFNMTAGYMTLNGSNYEIWSGFENYDGSSGTGAEDVNGTSGTNWILLGSGDNQADGAAGDDVLKGGGGTDYLYGNDGNDSVLGEDGDDSLYGMDGDDTLTGGEGNDLMKGGGGADSFSGGNGIDTVNYSDSTSGVTVDLAGGTGSGGTAEGDTFSGVENVDGSGHADFLGGDDNANVLNGLGDVDWLFGEGGADALNGGTGDDLLKGGGGADALDGGDGIDMASYSDSAAGVTVNLATGTGTGGDAEGDTLANIESLTGSDLNDTLTGNTGANTINGGLGDDTLSGGGGIDTLSGGDGNDTLIESNPNTPGDVFNGGAGIDTLLATQTWTTGVLFDLVAGTMTYLGTVYDTLSGIENLTLGGNANVTGDANANVITMTSAFGNNTVNSGGGDDTVYAGGGNDTVRGGTGTDAVYGEAGDDLIIIAGGDGLDNAYGGDGIDTLDYTGTAGDIVFNMITGAFDYNSNLRDAQGFENFTGSNGADTVFGTAGANTILGNSGDDTIRGGAGADVLDGGAGSNDMLSYTGSNAGVAVDLSTNIANGGHATGDTISGFESINGSSFGDTLIGDAGVNRIYGNEGNDIVRGGAGGDILGGGAGGADLLSYEGSDAGVTVDLGNNTANGGHATGDVIATFERVLGTIFNDVLLGSGGSNQLRGDLGDDTLRGGAGADQLFGGTGGSDTVSYAGSNAGVTVDIGANTANGGHATGDLISGFENIFGSGFNDTLTGSVDANVLNGGAGDDTILGMGGDDTIDGGANADRIDGGGGHDTLTGGFGSDTFVLGYYASGSDIITDFNVAADQLEISAADFGGGLVAGVLPAGQFLANNTGLAGDANDRFILNTLTGDLFFDVNGTGAGGSRLIATFTGVIPVLTSADFTIV